MVNFDINISSLKDAIQNLGRVVTEGERSSQHPYPFQSFKAKNNDSKIAVIDGSHHIIKGVNSVFSTIRSGFQIYQYNQKVEEYIEPIIIELITKSNDLKNGYIAKHEMYFTRITDEIPKGNMEFDKVTERIRTLLEWEKVQNLLEILEHGDIIMFDGSLISGVISTSKTFYEKLVEQAKEKGIVLVGLSKDTSLSINSAPVPFVLSESAKLYHPDKNWFVPFDDTYFIKFRKNIDLIFRLDIITPEDFTVEDTVQKIAAYCFAAGMEGFPYPMQTIHDAVRIDEMQRDHCFSLFKEQCLKSDISRKHFEQLFSIYHSQLDAISFGR
jgi:hypothetical protein